MKTKVLSLILCVVVMMTVFSACGKNDSAMELIQGNNYTPADVREAEPVYSVTYDLLGDNVMPLGVWWGPYGSVAGDEINGVTKPDYLTDEMFRLLKDSGVNFISCSPDQFPDARGSILKTLELCEKFDIGYFVQDSRLMTVEDAETAETLVQEYIEHPNCFGVHLTDEPFIEEMEGLRTPYRVFSETKYAGNKQLYVNMLPSYSGTDRLGGTHYDYLTKFLETTNSPFLSYDNYPFRMQNTGTTYGLPSSYFKDLSVVRKVANEHEIPFWVFVQAGGQWEEQVGKPSLPLFPNEGETLWNINTCLAYGAKSIQYFTFLQPTHFANAGGNLRDYQREGMVGVMGNKTQWYYYIQKANQQIAAIDHILMNSAQKGVLATGFWADRIAESDKPSDCGERSWRELQNISSDNEETGIIIGCFDYSFEKEKSRSAYYIVNTDVTNKQKVTLHFDKKYGYDIIQRGKSVGVTGKTVTLTLERGEGVMLALR